MNVAGFYSDPHFGHKNIIEFSKRPFKDQFHMEEEFVQRYNRVIGKNDLVVWVGDCFFYHTDAEARLLLDQMNGYKVLVMGNHDVKNGKGFMARAGFDVVVEKEMFLQIGDRMCRVCHYPYWNHGKDDRYSDRRPPKMKGEVLIHGHTHSTQRRDGNSIHVGVDAWSYEPALMHEVAKLVGEI